MRPRPTKMIVIVVLVLRSFTSFHEQQIIKTRHTKELLAGWLLAAAGRRGRLLREPALTWHLFFFARTSDMPKGASCM